MVFIDRSLGAKRLPDFLRRLGFEVEIHKDHFKQEEDDHNWIPPVVGRGWIILSGDKRLSKDAENLAAVKSSKAQVLLVSDTNSVPEQ